MNNKIFIFYQMIKKTCPKCGKAPLFQSYLKPYSQCNSCGENFQNLRADDGPAWLSIFIVGHIVVPLMMWIERDFMLSYGAMFGIFVPFIIGLTLLVLPFSKSIFMNVMWVLYQRKSQHHHTS